MEKEKVKGEDIMVQIGFGKEDNTITCSVYEAKTDTIVYGIAKCHPEDEFSTRIGERLAHTRAMAKYSKIKRRECEKRIKAIDNLKTFLFPKKLYGFGVDAIKIRMGMYLLPITAEAAKWKATEEVYKAQEKQVLAYIKRKYEKKNDL